MYRLSQAKVLFTKVPPITGLHNLQKSENHKRTAYHGPIPFIEVPPITGLHGFQKRKS